MCALLRSKYRPVSRHNNTVLIEFLKYLLAESNHAVEVATVACINERVTRVNHVTHMYYIAVTENCRRVTCRMSRPEVNQVNGFIVLSLLLKILKFRTCMKDKRYFPSINLVDIQRDVMPR